MANFINKFARSSQSIKEIVLGWLKTDMPEITDYNSSNPLIRVIEWFAGVLEQVHYYLNAAAREAFLFTARRFTSVVRIAKMYDYRISGAIAAEANLSLTFSGNLPTNFVIPRNTKFTTQSGLIFQSLENVTVLAGTNTATVRVLQFQIITGYSTTSDGTASQRIPLVAKIVDGSVVVRVDGITYTHQDTLYLSSPTELHFTTSINSDGVMEVLFGDGQNAVIPALDAVIEIDYHVTEGAAGNVSEQAINILSSNLTIPNGLTVTVSNPKAATGGAAQQNIDSVRVGVAKRMNTIKRAVTEKDFKVLAESIYGVGKAIVLHTCGYETRLFIAPLEGGEAQTELLTKVSDFMDLRRTINIDLVVASAGVIEMDYDIEVEAIANFANTAVTASVIQTLEDFHSLENQANGSQLYLSDLYQAIEGTTGVRRSQITRADIHPYARIMTGTNVLDWTRKIAATSTTTNVFEIEIDSATTFTVTKDSVLVGTYNIGDLVSLTEVEFTITGSYTVGDKWEFYSYPSFNTLGAKLVITDEPSFYDINLANSSITVTGGLID